MGKNNIELLKLAQAHLGQGGGIFNRYCGSSGAWCCAFVTYMFHEGNDSPLFYAGKKVVYCPTAIKWASANLAMIPAYLALPMDIVFFDWNHNGLPDHIGFIRERKNCDEVYTIEGNTDKVKNGKVVAHSVVAERIRPVGYIQGIYRPHFTAKFDISKPLEIDGLFGYNSIAMLQKALKMLGYYSGEVDAIMGKGTVKAVQAWAGVAKDGAWGEKTSKTMQKKLGVKADGLFGNESCKALQRWCSNEVHPQNKGQQIANTAVEYVGKVPYKKGGKNIKKAVDCTGFVQEIYRLCGIKLSEYLKDWGKSIGTDIKKAKAGDIITFKNKKTGKISHHGIYIGNGRVCHATGGKKVCVSDLPLYGLKIEGIRRRWK
jgi:cell wall-associated NlpC family hydrolase